MELYFGLLFLVTFFAFVLPDVHVSLWKQHGIMAANSLNFDKKKGSRNIKLSFWIVFIILATFLVIRDGIGSDYDSYMWHIGKIQAGEPHYMEIGFQKLVI